VVGRPLAAIFQGAAGLSREAVGLPTPAVQEDEFLTPVEQLLGSGRDRARKAAEATLQTLGERIASGEARDLAEQLPPELAPWLAADDRAQPFDVDEFLHRVARREGVNVEEAERHARAVFEALRRTVTADEYADTVAELPKTFAPLLPTGPSLEVAGADNFVRRVAARTGIDRRAAKRAVEAVLETLAERIAGGEVDDLIARTPAGVHPPLQRGKENSGGKARGMSFEQFVAKVAEREGVDREAAREHAVDVLRTLRDAVGEDEFFDLAAELPADFHEALRNVR
jgi:uncharacterized protein (DUF2267 family)